MSFKIDELHTAELVHMISMGCFKEAKGMNFCISVTAAISLALVSGSVLSEGPDKADPTKAYFQQVSNRAGKGDLDALMCLADLYDMGVGTAPDDLKAQAARQAAADKGSHDGKEAIYAKALYAGSPQALTDLHVLADGGFLPASTIIGDAYEYGLSVPKNTADAMRWYKKAAASDDPLAEIRLGTIYSHGDGVKPDLALAKYWLEKAASHEVDCFGSFELQSSMIIKGYYHPDPVPMKSDSSTMHATGPVGIRFIYSNGRAADVTLTSSSGIPIFDQAMLRAARSAKLSPWPKSYVSGDKAMSFKFAYQEEGVDPDFARAVFNAIDAAKKFPAYVLLHGSAGTGKARVSFDYLDGKVKNIKIEESTGDAHEDEAAIEAVNDAVYPPPLKQYEGLQIHLSVGIVFQDIESTPSSNTTSVPVAATH